MDVHCFHRRYYDRIQSASSRRTRRSSGRMYFQLAGASMLSHAGSQKATNQVYVACGHRLGPPVVPFYPFWGECSPTKVDYRKKIGYPYSTLSTGGPSRGRCSARVRKRSASLVLLKVAAPCSAGMLWMDEIRDTTWKP